MSTTFKRVVGVNNFWWHWMPACVFWNSFPTWKKQGKTIVTQVVEEGFPATNPGTYTLCPGCMALHLRRSTKDIAVYVLRLVVPVKFIKTPVAAVGPTVTTVEQSISIQGSQELVNRLL